MSLELQVRINNDDYQKRFLSEYSYWYKYLNRDDDYYPDFINDMKDKYELKTEDKLNRMMENINMIKSIFDVFK